MYETFLIEEGPLIEESIVETVYLEKSFLEICAISDTQIWSHVYKKWNCVLHKNFSPNLILASEFTP